MGGVVAGVGVRILLNGFNDLNHSLELLLCKVRDFIFDENEVSSQYQTRYNGE